MAESFAMVEKDNLFQNDINWTFLGQGCFLISWWLHLIGPLFSLILSSCFLRLPVRSLLLFNLWFMSLHNKLTIISAGSNMGTQHCVMFQQVGMQNEHFSLAALHTKLHVLTQRAPCILLTRPFATCKHSLKLRI